MPGEKTVPGRLPVACLAAVAHGAARPRRAVLLAGALGGLGLALPAARAQSFPDRPLRMIVPFPAGGPTDIVARPLAAQLGEMLKQPVVIDNRGGSGGAVGADAVAKARPDGYTLLVGTVGTAAINVSLYRALPYDPVRDFTPIAMLAAAPVAVVVNAAQPIATVADLIAAARANPDRIGFGSAGNGTPGHLTGQMFAAAAGVSLTHVPYRGSAPAVTDLIAGVIPLMFDPVQSVLPHIRAGRLRPLAVSSAERAGVLAEVPTLAESGLAGFETVAWWALFAPAGLPAGEHAQLRAAVLRVLASDPFAERLLPLGVQPAREQPPDFAAFQQAEIAKWGQAVRAAGVTAD
jgi:tripartite-type tricarboxylate transporter receptor subunit TctC